MAKYLLFASKNGLVKKTPLEEYQNIRQSGLVAVKLDANDRLLETRSTDGDDQVLLITASGKSILFHESEVRATGRATRGVKGITLKKDDHVIGMDVIGKDEKKHARKKYEVLVITANGYGKKTSLAEYHQQGRGGQGVFSAKTNTKTGKVVDMRLLRHDQAEDESTDPNDLENYQDLLVISQHGQTIRLSLGDVPVLGRHTQGVRILKLNSGDKATALAIL